MPVEPLASGVLHMIPRHVALKQTKSLAGAINGSRRVSLASNFFTPTPRQDKGKGKAATAAADVEQPLDEVLGCQSWAYSCSKAKLWDADGVMRSVLLGELDDTTRPRTSGRRLRRTSQSSRKRFHPSLCPSLPDPGGSQNHHHSSYSTATPLAHKKQPTASFLPTSYLERQPDEYLAPMQRFLNVLAPQVQSRDNLEALKDAYDVALPLVFPALSPQDARHVFTLFGRQLDSMCVQAVDYKIVQEWGGRMAEAYAALKQSTKKELARTLERHAFASRALSFMGQWGEAQKGIDVLVENRERPLVQNLFNETLESHLLSRHLYEPVYHALAYWGHAYVEGWGCPTASSTFGRLVAETSELPDALERIGEWKHRKRRIGVLKYCLAATLAYQKTGQCLLVVEAMEKMSIPVPSSHMQEFCRLLAKEGKIDKAKELLATVTPSEHDFYIQTKLFIEARAGDLESGLSTVLERQTAGIFRQTDAAAVLFSSRPDPFSLKKHFEQIFPMGPDGKREPVPAIQIYTNCLQVHANAGDVKGVNWWLKDMEQSEVKPDLYFYTTLVKLFKNVGDDQSLLFTYRRLLQDGIQPDAVIYSLLISHFANRKDSKGADALFVDAISRGVVPDNQMYTALQNAHIQAGSWKEANRVFRHLTTLKTSKTPQTDTYNFMLRGHLTMGAPFSTLTKLYMLMKKRGMAPDNHTITTMVLGACEGDLLDTAVDILAEARKKEVETGQKLVSQHTMTILMSAFLRRGDKVAAKEILDEMISVGLEPTSVTYGAIIKAYGTSGLEEDMQDAERFVQNLLAAPEEKQLSWNKANTKKQPLEHLYLPMLVARNLQNDVAEVERLYDEFLDAGGRPSVSMYHQLLVAYQKSNNVEKALELWPLLYELADRETVSYDDTVPTPSESSAEAESEKPHNTFLANIQAPLSVYIELLSQAGMHIEVANVWLQLQARGLFFNTDNWNQLVLALLRAAQLERAFEVMEKVLLPNQNMSDINTRLVAESRRPLPLGGIRAGYKKVDLYENLQTVSQPGPPLWGSQNRIAVAATRPLRTADVDHMRLQDDYSYPMKALELVRPGKDEWAPHFDVYQTMVAAWMQLERGYIIEPLGPRESFKEADINVGERDPTFTEDLIAKLQEQYPATVRRLEDFRSRERRRLGSANFEGMYVRR